MERVLSDYEKIRKAEAIYNRRKMRDIGGIRVSSPTSFERKERSTNVELKNVKKMVIQMWM